MTVEYRIGDCLEVLKDYPDDHFDSCVTDPPYGLEFMGKEWDAPWKDSAIVTNLRSEGGFQDGNGGNPYTRSRIRYQRDSHLLQQWHTVWAKEVLRVLKPGAHLLSFGGTRTYHRMTCALEDVGFEIRDCLMWLYGSGFPKSHDVGKAIDRHLGGERQVVGISDALRGRKSDNKESFGQHIGNQPVNQYADGYPITEPATPEASKWQGWGTALKPAYEPIVLARKPLIGTVAENVLMHGTGGINVDGCRIETLPEKPWGRVHPNRGKFPGWELDQNMVPAPEPNSIGRWPSNLLLDEESAKMLDEQSGETNIGHVPSLSGGAGGKGIYGTYHPIANQELYYPSGGASRFFYIAKADRFEREAGLVGNIECSRCNKLAEEGQWPVHEGDHIYNDHPTVKPIELMRYLVRLVTPRNGLCLDPFVGSGTTLIADMFEGVNGVGIEKDAEKKGTIFYRLEYWRPIAEKRKTEEAQERKDQSHRIAETLRTLDHFESDEIEEEENLGDGTINGDTSKVH